MSSTHHTASNTVSSTHHTVNNTVSSTHHTVNNTVNNAHHTLNNRSVYDQRELLMRCSAAASCHRTFVHVCGSVDVKE